MPQRRKDLVWIGNGLPVNNESTLVLPHYSVLLIGGPVQRKDGGPPTYLWGRHERFVQKLLLKDGVPCRSVDCIKTPVAFKVLWASIFWLYCHYDYQQKRTIGQVLEEGSWENLAAELWPMTRRLCSANVQIEDAKSYIRKYSRSIASAIPSLELACQELPERNGLLAGPNQPLHSELIAKVAGQRALEIFAPNNKVKKKHEYKIIDLRNVIGASFFGTANQYQRTDVKHVIVVGAGIMGSFIALNLVRQNLKVTVIDRLESSNFGNATSASWAWLNANQKLPPEYKLLNAFGMHAWRNDPDLKDLPRWTGSLVSQERALDIRDKVCGGYFSGCVGPLEKKEWIDIEPLASFAPGGLVYFFPQEGYVDPYIVVERIRERCRQRGVQFLWKHEVVGVARNVDDDKTITGVECRDLEAVEKEPIFLEADHTVLATGFGELGSIPQLDRPGSVAFLTPIKSLDRSLINCLLVDQIARTHILQRSDGTLVVGGGKLEVGGQQAQNSQNERVHPDTEHLLRGARNLLPTVIGDFELLRVVGSNRPMPLDGLPAVGGNKDGNYLSVCHSGVTLAPLLGALVAMEISSCISLELISSYRPGRFRN